MPSEKRSKSIDRLVFAFLLATLLRFMDAARVPLGGAELAFAESVLFLTASIPVEFTTW